MLMVHSQPAKKTGASEGGGRSGERERNGWRDRRGLVCKRLAKTRHMRHRLLVLIREPILQDKSEMVGGGGVRERRAGRVVQSLGSACEIEGEMTGAPEFERDPRERK